MVENYLHLIEMIVKYASIIIGTAFLILSFKKIVNKNKKIQYFFYIFFYLFFIVPQILQICFPSYVYLNFPRANEAMIDEKANLIYDFFCLIFMTLIIRSGKKEKKNSQIKKQIFNKFTINLFLLQMIIVLFYTIVTNNIFSLFKYGSGYTGEANINETFMGVGTISFFIILANKRFISNKKLILSILIEFSFIWLVGKRYILAETVIISLIILVLTDGITTRNFIRLFLFSSVVVLIFCIAYGYYFKGNISSIIDYFFVDFSRQYTLVYQFYCYNINKAISVKRFDAIIYLLTFWIPRTWWPAKPYPFVNQLTYSLVVWTNSPSNINVGWATTCSIFSDLFDSFSFLGIVIGFVLFLCLFKYINRAKNCNYRIIALYLCVRLITVQISSAIVQITICLIELLICEHLPIKKCYYYANNMNLKSKQ